MAAGFRVCGFSNGLKGREGILPWRRERPGKYIPEFLSRFFIWKLHKELTYRVSAFKIKLHNKITSIYMR